jgi:multicomponent Na+:H+ antiporter subunit D
MVVGLVAALSETDFRRILSFNLVAHIGYTTAALALLTPLALAGSIFYILHHILVITNLFLVSGVMLRLRRTTDVEGLGSFYRSQPVYAALAMIPIFSLAGVPPLSGFLGKLAIVEGTFEAGAYWVGGTVLFVGLLTLLSMARVWADAFWKPAARGRDAMAPGTPLLATIAALSVLTLAVTLAAEPLFALTSRAAVQLLDPQSYISAVLEGGR